MVREQYKKLYGDRHARISKKFREPIDLSNRYSVNMFDGL